MIKKYTFIYRNADIMIPCCFTKLHRQQTFFQQSSIIIIVTTAGSPDRDYEQGNNEQT